MTVTTSAAKMAKMLQFIPDVTAKGNGAKVRECYEALLNTTDAGKVFDVMSQFGGTLGYKTVAYLMEFVRIGQEPPQTYFGQEIVNQKPQPEDTKLEETRRWLEELGIIA